MSVCFFFFTNIDNGIDFWKLKKENIYQFEGVLKKTCEMFERIEIFKKSVNLVSNLTNW